MKQLGTAFFIIAAFAFGLAVGDIGASRLWIKDCDLVGKHRINDKVYFCFPEGSK